MPPIARKSRQVRRTDRRRLYEASRKFRRVRFLDYVMTSNHVDLLLWVPRMHDLSAMMRWLQGTFARDYNLRQEREGSFWRGHTVFGNRLALHTEGATFILYNMLANYT